MSERKLNWHIKLMSNLFLRILTAIVLAAIALWFTWIGGRIFALFSWAIGAAVYYEWQNLTVSVKKSRVRAIGWLIYCLTAVAFTLYIPAYSLFVVLFIAFVILVILSLYSKIQLASGFLYAALPSAALTFLRGDTMVGFDAVLFLFAVVWGTDIGAYFSGRTIQGPKLAPFISPNKTWSGAIGGAIIGILCGEIIVYLFMHGAFVNPLTLVLALAISVVSQIGDIFESWIKRRYKAKDSSNILPGHGGFMDRVDGLVFAAVLLYVIGSAFGNGLVPSTVFNLF